MKWKVVILVFKSIIVACIMLLFMPQNVKAEMQSNELKLDSNILKWAFDEEKERFFAVTSGNVLMNIDGTSMSCVNTINLDGKVSDVLVSNGKVYISYMYKKRIDIYNGETLQKVNTLETLNDVYHMEKAGEQILYSNATGDRTIYQYDLVSDADKYLIGTALYNSSFKLSEDGTKVYAVANWSMGCRIYEFDSSSDERLNTYSYSNHDIDTESLYSNKLMLNNGRLYYMQRDFDANNLPSFDGDYSGSGKMIYISEELVFSEYGVFGRNSYRLLGNYAGNEKMDMIEIGDHAIYLYSDNKKILRKYPKPEKGITTDSIIGAIGGINVPSLSQNLKSKEVFKGSYEVAIKEKLDGWVEDNVNDKLYAYSIEQKAVFSINSKTLSIEKCYIFKSAPRDVAVDNGLLYVALEDIRSIAVLNAKDGMFVKNIQTNYRPSSIAKGKNFIYVPQTLAVEVILKELGLCCAEGNSLLFRGIFML